MKASQLCDIRKLSSKFQSRHVTQLKEARTRSA